MSARQKTGSIGWSSVIYLPDVQLHWLFTYFTENRIKFLHGAGLKIQIKRLKSKDPWFFTRNPFTLSLKSGETILLIDSISFGLICASLFNKRRISLIIMGFAPGNVFFFCKCQTYQIVTMAQHTPFAKFSTIEVNLGNVSLGNVLTFTLALPRLLCASLQTV